MLRPSSSSQKGRMSEGDINVRAVFQLILPITHLREAYPVLRAEKPGRAGIGIIMRHAAGSPDFLLWLAPEGTAHHFSASSHVATRLISADAFQATAHKRRFVAGRG
jgi:hypothetical protein